MNSWVLRPEGPSQLSCLISWSGIIKARELHPEELLSGAEYLRGLERACLLENTLSSLEASTSIDKSISENFVWLFLLKLLGLNSESQCKGLVRQTKNYFPVTSPFVHFCDQTAL